MTNEKTQAQYIKLPVLIRFLVSKFVFFSNLCTIIKKADTSKRSTRKTTVRRLEYRDLSVGKLFASYFFISNLKQATVTENEYASDIN